MQLQELVSAEQEQQPELRSHKHQNHNQLSSTHCRSNRQQSRNHNFAEPAQLHGEHFGRSQPEHRSEQKPHMGCSSSCYGEPGHRFRQPLPGEPVRLCR